MTAVASPVSAVPDARGRFGAFGGRFVPETLMFALEQLDAAYQEARADPLFIAEFHKLLNEYVGRPSRLYYADRLTTEAGGAPHIPQAGKTSTTPAPTRSTTPSARRCSPSGWARPG